MSLATLSPREVAEIAGAPKRVVERAIEENVPRAERSETSRRRRMLPLHAAVVAKLDLKLTAAQKKRLLHKLTRLEPQAVRAARIELAPAVEVDIGRLVGDAMDRALHYRAARDKFIVADAEHHRQSCAGS
jgi:hypothetical protein